MYATRTRSMTAFEISFTFALLLLGVSAYSSTAAAQSPGAFTATGHMSVERMSHTSRP